MLALGTDDFSRRFELQKQQDELRREVAQFHEDADEGRSTAELEAELEARRAQLKSIKKQRIDVVMQSGGGSHGGDMGAIGIPHLNRSIESAQGAGAIKERIAKLEQVLAERIGDS